MTEFDEAGLLHFYCYIIPGNALGVLYKSSWITSQRTQVIKTRIEAAERSHFELASIRNPHSQADLIL